MLMPGTMSHGLDISSARDGNSDDQYLTSTIAPDHGKDSSCSETKEKQDARWMGRRISSKKRDVKHKPTHTQLHHRGGNTNVTPRSYEYDPSRPCRSHCMSPCRSGRSRAGQIGPRRAVCSQTVVLFGGRVWEDRLSNYLETEDIARQCIG